jgi:hypothetical protein
MSSHDLINWLNKDIENKLISEYILDINDTIQKFIKNKNISFKGDKDLFLMKLILFLNKNSSV